MTHARSRFGLSRALLDESHQQSMVNRNLIRGLEYEDDTLDRDLEAAMGGETADEHYWGGEEVNRQFSGRWQDPPRR